MPSEQHNVWPHPVGDGKLREEIVRLEVEIEKLTGVMDRCRKLGLIAQTAIVAGATLLLAFTVGLIGLHPVSLIGALAAVIGGIVVFGSNASTLKQAGADMKAAEARRAELIDTIDLRPVGGSEQLFWTRR